MLQIRKKPLARCLLTLGIVSLLSVCGFSTTFTEYVVKPGDTLSKIATEFHCSIDTISQKNALKNIHYIVVGQVLQLPQFDTTQVAQLSSAKTYVVQAKDTLSGIAKKHQVTVAEIVAWNGIPDPNFILVGAELQIESAGVLPLQEQTLSSNFQDHGLETEEDVTLLLEEHHWNLWEQGLSSENTSNSKYNDGVSLEFTNNSRVFLDEKDWLVLDGKGEGVVSLGLVEFEQEDAWMFTGTHSVRASTKITAISPNDSVVTAEILCKNEENGEVIPLVQVIYLAEEKALKISFQEKTNQQIPPEEFYFYGVDLGDIYHTEMKVAGGSVYVILESQGRKEVFFHDFMADDPNWQDFRSRFAFVNRSANPNSLDGAVVKLNGISSFHDKDVTEYIPPEKLWINSTEITMSSGETHTLQLQFQPIDTLNKGVIWSVVSGESVVSVDEKGNITAISLGEATVRASSQDNPSIYVDCQVLVDTLSFFSESSVTPTLPANEQAESKGEPGNPSE